MATIAPPPISKFAPPRTFEHTPPSQSSRAIQIAQNEHASNYTPSYIQHQSLPQQQQHQQHHLSSNALPPIPTQSHPSSYPPAPAAQQAHLVPSTSPSPSSEAIHRGKSDGNRQTGTLSKLKRSFLLRQRAPLSRTWEKASFAEECQSAPASMVDVSGAGAGGLASGGQYPRGIELQSRASAEQHVYNGNAGIGEAVQMARMPQARRGGDCPHSALFRYVMPA